MTEGLDRVLGLEADLEVIRRWGALALRLGLTPDEEGTEQDADSEHRNKSAPRISPSKEVTQLAEVIWRDPTIAQTLCQRRGQTDDTF